MIAAAARARAAVRCLRAGIVPHSVIEELSGAGGPIRDIGEQSLRILGSGRRPKPLLLRGEWGAGKTHFLSYVRAQTSRYNVANASVILNARTTALNYPQRLYPVIAETLKAGGNLGLKAILSRTLRNAERREAVRQQLTGHAHAGSLLHLLHATQGDGLLDIGEHWAWTPLLGADIAPMDYPYKRVQALARLQALSVVLRTAGFGGLVLLFDEAETIDQLWNVRSRLAAYDVVGQLCQMQALWCVFSVTGRFDRTIERDLENGILADHSVSEHAAWFLRAWSSNWFNSIELPQMDRTVATRVARAVARIYETGYGHSPRELPELCVQEWSANPARNPRRLMRLLIHRLDLARAVG